MEDPGRRHRVAAARVARLATIDADGRAHMVPICFAVEGGTLYTAVDRKPKRSRRLRRLENVRARPWATVLVDHYDEDWSRLWWERIRGPARVLPPGGDEQTRARALLAEKYAQYRCDPPDGPVIAVEMSEWRGWSAARPAAPRERLPSEGPAAPGGAAAAPTRRTAMNLALFGGFGKNRPAAGWRRETAVAVFGGGEVDLASAPPADGARLTAVAVFGGVSVTVPAGSRVTLSGASVLGGRDVKAPPGEGPEIRVRAIAVLGGVEVKEAPAPATAG